VETKVVKMKTLAEEEAEKSKAPRKRISKPAGTDEK